MGSIQSKTKQVNQTVSSVIANPCESGFQHGSSTGPIDPPQGDWILVKHDNSTREDPKVNKVSAAPQSASNASGHNGHITTNMKNIQEAVENLNNMFLLLTMEKDGINQFNDNARTWSPGQSTCPHPALYQYRYNNKTNQGTKDSKDSKSKKNN